MKLRWHWFWSLALGGLAFAAIHGVTGSGAYAFAAFATVFVLYWLGYAVFVANGDWLPDW
jgi:hypothetical protein